MFPNRDICKSMSIFKNKAAYIITYRLGYFFSKKKLSKIPHKQRIFKNQLNKSLNKVVQQEQMNLFMAYE